MHQLQTPRIGAQDKLHDAPTAMPYREHNNMPSWHAVQDTGCILPESGQRMMICTHSWTLPCKLFNTLYRNELSLLSTPFNS